MGPLKLSIHPPPNQQVGARSKRTDKSVVCQLYVFTDVALVRKYQDTTGSAFAETASSCCYVNTTRPNVKGDPKTKAQPGGWWQSGSPCSKVSTHMHVVVEQSRKGMLVRLLTGLDTQTKQHFCDERQYNERYKHMCWTQGKQDTDKQWPQRYCN